MDMAWGFPEGGLIIKVRGEARTSFHPKFKL
jgi:hypothetical protein